MKTFIRKNFKEGRILTRVNTRGIQSEAIRLTTGSRTDHNATSAVSEKGVLGFNEAVEPVSKHTSLDVYESLMNEAGQIIRIYRFNGFTDAQHAVMAQYFTQYLLGIPYPKKVRMALLASRLYNLFYDNVSFMPPLLRVKWCTALCVESARAVNVKILNDRNGKFKKLPTPKTIENRIVDGLFVDETDLWINDSNVRKAK